MRGTIINLHHGKGLSIIRGGRPTRERGVEHHIIHGVQARSCRCRRTWSMRAQGFWSESERDQ